MMRTATDQQPTLVASEIAVKVATQKKTEMIKLAEVPPRRSLWKVSGSRAGLLLSPRPVRDRNQAVDSAPAVQGNLHLGRRGRADGKSSIWPVHQ